MTDYANPHDDPEAVGHPCGYGPMTLIESYYAWLNADTQARMLNFENPAANLVAEQAAGAHAENFRVTLAAMRAENDALLQEWREWNETIDAELAATGRM